MNDRAIITLINKNSNLSTKEFIFSAFSFLGTISSFIINNSIYHHFTLAKGSNGKE